MLKNITGLFVKIGVMLSGGLVIGLVVNALASDPLPLLANRGQFQLKIEADRAADSSEIMQLYESGVLFVDARSQSAYRKGHIPGAILLDYHVFEQDDPDLIDKLELPKDVTIVVYCDGSDCQASHIVADHLLDAGYREDLVKVFSGGWEEWLLLGGEVDSFE